MKIQILDVKVAVVPTAKGSYKCAEVAYKDLHEGKVTGKKIMDFNDKKVFALIAKATPGQCFEIGMDKNEAGFWQWTSAHPIDEAEAATANPVLAAQQSQGAAQSLYISGGTPAPRSNYETPEERKIKQDYIIRQSSIAQAVAALKTEKNIPTYEDVAVLAEKFVKFVYNPLETIPTELEDDIPL